MPKQLKNSSKKNSGKKSRIQKNVRMTNEETSDLLLQDSASTYVQPAQKSGLQWGAVFVGLLFIVAVYAATKAYVVSLSEALAVELADRHIAVSCVCPGPTPTNFGKNARRPGQRDIDRSGQGLLRVPPERVVADALSALEHGKACVFPSLRVTLAASIFRLMPRSLMRFFIRLRHAKGRQTP